MNKPRRASLTISRGKGFERPDGSPAAGEMIMARKTSGYLAVGLSYNLRVLLALLEDDEVEQIELLDEHNDQFTIAISR